MQEYMFTMFCFIRLNFQSPHEVHVLKNLLSDFFVLFYIEIITGNSFTLYIIHSFSFYKRNETIFFYTLQMYIEHCCNIGMQQYIFAYILFFIFHTELLRTDRQTETQLKAITVYPSNLPRSAFDFIGFDHVTK